MGHSAEQDPHATGDGAVMLDIGGDIGAVIVVFPPDLLGREVEIVPADGRVADDTAVGGFHAGANHPAGAPPHVGIVPRRMGADPVPTAVFGDLSQGSYRLSLVTHHHHHDDEPGHDHDHGDSHSHDHAHAEHAHDAPTADATVVEVEVVGGEVATVTWPGA